jgi:hypothetical protein
MSLSRQMLPLALALALIGAAPASASAQGGATGAASRAQGDGAARAALLAERQRLRVELDRANAEIDSLKRANRSLRDDYRLRARLADAEALARRLTELDARLGGGTAARESWTNAGTEPRGLPSDGPAELEAKADILSDQARRLAARGEALLVRARDLKARQNLRRRVGQMERDPFSPLEGSKRRAMAVGTPSGARDTSLVTPTKGGGPTSGGSGQSTTPATSPEQTTPPPSGSGLAPAPGAGQSDRGPASVSAVPPASQPLGGSAVTAPKTGPTPTSPGGLAESATLSAQLRDLLDPATLAELQKIEATAGPVSGVEALERAGAALKARADRLQREAAALRAARGK